MNIIFLDFDGTIVTKQSEALASLLDDEIDFHATYKDWMARKIDPVLLNNVKILQQTFNAKIVISSAWRYFDDLDTLRRYLQERGDIDPASIIDQTPYSDDCRGWEIRDWLKANSVTNYLILDDDEDVKAFPEAINHWIQLNPKFGFTKEKLQEALQKIEAR